jgi:hypothetical protein
MIPADSTFASGNLPTQMLARRLGVDVPDLSPDYARHCRLERVEAQLS